MTMTMTAPTYQTTAEPAEVLNFYNIRQEPFYLLPDSAFTFASESHQSGIAQLMTFALEFHSGFSLLAGESGVGKTLLIQTFNKMLPWQIRFLKISERLENQSRLLHQLSQLLDIKPDGLLNMRKVYEQFKAFSKAGQHFILLIDDAHMMSDELLTALVELSNYDAKHSKFIKFLLVGQPSLELRLNALLNEKLMLKSGVKIRLKALERHEIEPYVKHRLQAAGCPEAGEHFTAFSFDEIYHFSVGIPRLINQLCRKAMRIAAAQDNSLIDERVIEIAAFRQEEIRANGNPHSIVPKPGMGQVTNHSFTPKNITPETKPAAAPERSIDIRDEKPRQVPESDTPANGASSTSHAAFSNGSNKPVDRTVEPEKNTNGVSRTVPANGQKELPVDVQTDLPVNGQQELPTKKQAEKPANKQKELPVKEQKEPPVNERAKIPANGRKELPVNAQKKIAEVQNGTPADSTKRVGIKPKTATAPPTCKVPAFKPQLPGFTAPYLEDVHRILENLAITIAENKYRVIGVISSVAGEGSTTILAAISYLLTNIHNTRQHSESNSIRPLLLIDANIKNPGLHKILNAAPAPGLQDLAGNHSTVKACLQKFNGSAIELMSAGNIDENFWSRLSPETFENTLNTLRQQYQKIFVDLPPVLQHGDGITFSKMCDAVVLVIKAGETRHQVVQKSIQLLETAGIPIIGGILNQREFHIPEKIYRSL